jgi:hypothetical protein
MESLVMFWTLLRALLHVTFDEADDRTLGPLSELVRWP